MICFMKRSLSTIYFFAYQWQKNALIRSRLGFDQTHQSYSFLLSKSPINLRNKSDFLSNIIQFKHLQL